jgi:hypothetical protein
MASGVNGTVRARYATEGWSGSPSTTPTTRAPGHEASALGQRSSSSVTSSRRRLSLELTPEGLAAVRSQVNPDKLARVTRRWSASEHEEILLGSG